MLEVSVAVAILVVILLGTFAAISTGFVAQEQNSEWLDSQMLAQQVLEETESVAFESLVALNGQFVTSGAHRADISVSYVNSNLVRVEIATSSTQFPNVSTRVVTMIADLD